MSSSKQSGECLKENTSTKASLGSEISISLKSDKETGAFFSKVKSKDKTKLYTLIRADQTKIKRYIKIKGKATPFDEDYVDYFTCRENILKRERINNRIVNKRS